MSEGDAVPEAERREGYHAPAGFTRSIPWQRKLRQKNTIQKRFGTLAGTHLSGAYLTLEKIAWASYSVWREKEMFTACILGRSLASCSTNQSTSIAFWSNTPMTSTKAWQSIISSGP